MKSLTTRIAVLLCCASTAWAQTKPEKFVVVRVTNHDASEQYSVLSTDEYKSLQMELRSESRFHAKALALAQREWAAGKDEAKKSFPRGAIRPRTATILGNPFSDRSAASDKCSEYEIRRIESMARNKERDKERQDQIAKVKQKGQKGRPPQTPAQKQAAEEDKMKEQQREALAIAADARAQALYESKLQELMQAAGTSETDASAEL